MAEASEVHRLWWLVTYWVPERGQWVKQVEWMSDAEADVKQRAVGQPVKRMDVRDLEGVKVKGSGLMGGFIVEEREGRTREGDGQTEVIRQQTYPDVDAARRARWRMRQEWIRDGFTNIHGEWWNGWTWREVWVIDEVTGKRLP